MHELLRELGDPQRRYPAIHVVGTNGKSTTTRMTAALLRGEGLRVGAYTSPHVRGWGERIQVDGADVDFEAAVGRVREAAEHAGATQFETLTAAALAAFEGVDVAVVEAGLGGRLDATNVLDAPVVVLTNVSLDHTDVLGETREAIAAEKLAVVRPGATVVLGEAEWEAGARAAGAAQVVVVDAKGDALAPNRSLAAAAAAAFLGRPPGNNRPQDEDGLAGRYERRGPREVRDGAHNPAGAAHLARSLGPLDAVLVVSLVADKDVDGVLRELTRLGATLVATESTSGRALPAAELAAHARGHFARVETVAEPAAALARARELAGPEGMVLVTGSLYLLADLHAVA